MTSTEKTKFDEVIENIISRLKETTKFKITDKHKLKIKSGLEDAFATISNKNIEEHHERIVNKVSSALERDNTWWSKVKNLLGLREAYEISNKKITKIAKHEIEALGIALQGADKVRSEMQKKANIKKKVMPDVKTDHAKMNTKKQITSSGRVH